VIWGALAGLAATPAVAALARRLRHSTVHLAATGWGTLAAGCILAGAAAAAARPPAAAALIAVLLAAFLAAAAVDASEQRLPDLVTIGAGVLGLAALTAVTLTTGTGSPWRALAGGAIFGGWILAGALLVRDGYGLGDVKLAASLGILLGWASWMTLAMSILASQIAVTVMLLHARSRGRNRTALGAAFVAGALSAVILVPI
jgi:leader peptidase (prepilin peptidase)/N-methyltransferase